MRSAGEGGRPRIDQYSEVRARGDVAKHPIGLGAIEFRVEQGGGRRQFSACREAHDANAFGIDVPTRRVGANQPDGLKGVIHRVLLDIVPVGPQAVTQDDRADPVLVEKRNKVGTF